MTNIYTGELNHSNTLRTRTGARARARARTHTHTHSHTHTHVTKRNVLLPDAHGEQATSLTRLVEPNSAVEAVVYADLLWWRRPASCNMAQNIARFKLIRNIRTQYVLEDYHFH